ncbi:MAG: mrpG [Phycisphaerales bacterium]|jgi:multisubunit Na+/H+ antiporter MnhG subunit|nr:mrpG [Phycisphaerales bacterium]MDB5301675.1 mrpG [Phycisphaerales bacterium]MDB5304337.1 mrpG [Phycisphaerales bacterium]
MNPPAAHPVVTGILLGIAVGVAIACSIGTAVMRDALQRLHYSAPVVSISVLLIAIAVWLEEGDPQARIKVILTGGVLFVMNSVLTHATAKAIRIKRTGHWEVREGEPIVIVRPKDGDGRRA